MLKKWFTLPSLEEEPAETVRAGSAEPARPAAATEESAPTPRAPAAATNAPAGSVPKYSPFDQIYQNASIKPPRLSYGILKVAEMVNSAYLGGLSPDAKRCSILMALEAAGAEIEDLLQDAVVRQRALNDFEESQRKRVEAFEQSKLDENTKIQQDLERITSQHMARIQSNLDEVAREQDNFRGWQRSKQQESQHITEAAAYCVPQSNGNGVSNLTAVLERATVSHK